jgi:hypothetical protein
VADFILSKRFLTELSHFEKTASSRDRQNLDETLAAIAQNPQLPGRVPSFYDPASPSYLYRSGNIVIHYRETDDEEVEFLNLFWPRV